MYPAFLCMYEDKQDKWYQNNYVFKKKLTKIDVNLSGFPVILNFIGTCDVIDHVIPYPDSGSQRITRAMGLRYSTYIFVHIYTHLDISMKNYNYKDECKSEGKRTCFTKFSKYDG